MSLLNDPSSAVHRHEQGPYRPKQALQIKAAEPSDLSFHDSIFFETVACFRDRGLP
jgi:hypothetical protein